jgi:GNAT superfamily N-acetyltransferase
MPSEHHGRVFSKIHQVRGRYCPHYGGFRSTKLAGVSSRSGVYQRGEAECRGQFTVTTKTPLHATKLNLRIWISAKHQSGGLRTAVLRSMLEWAEQMALPVRLSVSSTNPVIRLYEREGFVLESETDEFFASRFLNHSRHFEFSCCFFWWIGGFCL